MVLPLMAEKTNQEILIDAQAVSYKHESNSKFLVSDSLTHYIIQKDEYGQLAIAGLFEGNLVRLENKSDIKEAMDHYTGTYFVVNKNSENLIYYKDDYGDVFPIKLAENQTIKPRVINTEGEVVQKSDGKVVVGDHEDDEEDDDDDDGFPWVTLVLVFLLFRWIFLD